MKYFHHCASLDEIKATYKKLAKENHPDVGGDTATMQSINTEYAFACASMLKSSKITSEEFNQKLSETEQYREALEKIINLEGIIIELVGLWIWVTGLTYPVRKQLKDAGFFFAPKKKAWYFRPEEYKILRGGKKSLEEIKAKYGSEELTEKKKNKYITH